MRFLLQRLAGIAPLMLVVSFLAFMLVRLAPGGPFDQDRELPPEAERELRERYLLDAPLWRQYLAFLGGALQGDLGNSTRFMDLPVLSIILQGLPVTFALGFLAFLSSLSWGIALGCLSAAARQPGARLLADAASLLGICIPALVIGPVLIMVFAIWLEWLPVALLASPLHFVLPVATLGIYYSGRVARLAHQGIQDTLQSEFVIAARAKGLSEARILVRHVLPLGLLPVLSYSGPLLADLLTGSFVAENLFQIPGVGALLVQSSLDRDYPMIVGLALLYALVLILLNLLVDLSYRLLDPRIRPA